MKTLSLLWVGIIAGAAAAGAQQEPLSYADAAALVEAAESGDAAITTEAIPLLAREPETPLAGAALGRLLVLRSERQPFVLMAYADLYNGMKALNAYIANHYEDPLPRVWRAASASASNYLLWDKTKTRLDLEFAIAAYAADPALPDKTARCKTILGLLAKDSGDLPLALRYWREAVEMDPLGPAGREAAALLASFTG